VSNTSLTRADLEKVFGNNVKVIRAFEQLAQQVITNTATSTANADATVALQDATVITLSSNETFTNERILAVDSSALTIQDNGAGSTVVLGLVNRITINGYSLQLNLQTDTYLDLPISGKIPSSDVGPYATDADAAAAGVEIGEIYKGPLGAVVWRQV